MEIGNKNEERKPHNEKLRSELIGVERAIIEFCGIGKSGFFGKECKQYLPNLITVPLINLNRELIAVQALRGDSIVVPRKPDRNLRETVPDPDFINIPPSFIAKDSYIVLLIPEYWGPDGTHITMYDTTVLKYVNNQQLVKLPGSSEAVYRSRWNEFRGNEGKLINPRFDRDYELLSTEINNNKEGMINIWLGEIDFISREREDMYKRVVNGTVCYRMIEGKVEKEGPRKEKRAPNFVPQIASA